MNKYLFTPQNTGQEDHNNSEINLNMECPILAEYGSKGPKDTLVYKRYLYRGTPLPTSKRTDEMKSLKILSNQLFWYRSFVRRAYNKK